MYNELTKSQILREEIVALRKEDPKITAAEMARRLGRSRERIRQLLVKLDLPTRISGPVKLCQYCNGPVKSNNKAKLFCSAECYSDSRNTLVICHNCGVPFKRRIKLIDYYVHVRNYERFFCDRKCFGSWSGRNHGWQTSRGYKSIKKSDEENIWERRNTVILRLLDVIRTSLLRHKEQ